MKKALFTLALSSAIVLTSCSSDDDASGMDETITIDNPVSYSFERDGESTVSFSGQTTRIKMAHELLTNFLDESNTAESLKAMFAHDDGAADFEDADLNASDKNLRSKTAASVDYFYANTTDQTLIRADFESWIEGQVNEVFANWNVSAAAGIAGQLADGEKIRYVNAKGLEYNQLFAKGLIGALMTDQALNNYLSPTVLDESSNRTDNDAGTVLEGKSYTDMEHKWDEAYGYVYGLNADASDPNADLGADNFLNEYIGKLEEDADFAGIADDIFQAFKLGRAAIVAGDYGVRDAQAEIIREKISLVPAVRGVFYMQRAKATLADEVPNYASAFHALSEAYGFIYSLRFTRKPGTDAPYFSKAESDELLEELMDDGANGLWDLKAETIDEISEDIAERFGFTVAQAAD
ncbi:DUF4856 domain-containing protein [Zobellia galactanivorans]|uniref:DUF4856 domain-containing protein n=1 Tax=Zobellia galactanivorans (strain DSM 12802 / CCUG 47099 / CIP 106680 / NCIMB 13871 / Dsij) TaxID=63186 RepID=UPI001C065782|nr:DUF4856 domain-containing protein [Zobellia galactanivorans]MBU3025463.1 DUF4856 domain-containing protein [Zobellia galactanivorans]